MVTSLTTTLFESLILSVSGFAMSYVANSCICAILDDFCLLPA